jgi:hypothetical protein
LEKRAWKFAFSKPAHRWPFIGTKSWLGQDNAHIYRTRLNDVATLGRAEQAGFNFT